MRQEWTTYWSDFRKKSIISLGWSILISMIFFVANIPFNKPGGYWLSFLISLAYGASVCLIIVSAYGGLYAVATYKKLKTGFFKEPSRVVNILTGIIAAGIGVLTASYVTSLIIGRPMSFSGTWYSIVVSSFIALMFVFYYSYKESQEENLKLKAAKAESELHVLKNQMQPHFLFNSLNSLLDLVETKSDQAPEMTMKLSSLYREILENSKKNLANLESEISIIEKYLDLEKLRFGDRLTFEIRSPKNSKDIYLPPLVLQTLVENAVKHGVSPSINGGTIEVRVEPQSDGYYLVVKNSGSSQGCNKSEGGTGLANTKARLKLIYGDRHGFELKKDNNSFNASFWFSGDLVHG